MPRHSVTKLATFELPESDECPMTLQGCFEHYRDSSKFTRRACNTQRNYLSA